MLAERGHKAVHVSDGNEALSLFYKLQPELVICDHQLTGLSGIEVCRLLKTHQSGLKSAFLLIIRTPSNAQLVKELAQRIQADDLIPKPCSVQDVVSKALEWLDPARRPTPLYERDLQAGAPKKTGGQKPLPRRGRLADISFPSLLFQIWRARFDGLVELRDKRKILRVAFQRGQPVFVQSNYIREDSLGRLLLENKKITEAQLEIALERASSAKIRLGEALRELKLLSEQELTRYLNDQHLVKLLGIFEPRWQEGEFILQPGPISLHGQSRADISSVALLQEGVRRSTTLKSLMPVFQRHDRMKRVCRAMPELDAVFGQLKMDGALIRIVELLRRGMKIPDIEALVQIDRETLLQFLFVLLTLHAARFDETPANNGEQAVKDLADAAQGNIKESSAPADYSQDFYIGKTYFEMGDFEKALPHLRQALQVRPTCPESLSMIGWATYNLRTPHDPFAIERAKDLFKQAIAKAPNHAKAHFYLAKIARAEKNDKLADSYAIKAHQCDPDDPEIKREFELALIRRRSAHR